jgi:hypothetical protein
MVAGNSDDCPSASGSQPVQGVIIELLGHGRRVYGVEDIPGNKHNLDVLFVHYPAQFVDEAFLLLNPATPLQGFPQMPVGRM